MEAVTKTKYHSFFAHGLRDRSGPLGPSFSCLARGPLVPLGFDEAWSLSLMIYQGWGSGSPDYVAFVCLFPSGVDPQVVLDGFQVGEAIV